MPACNCWISRCPPEEQFAYRYGAHSTSCPSFRESKDPVDRLVDEQHRRRAQHQEALDHDFESADPDDIEAACEMFDRLTR